jgi:heat shock protein HslJ
MRTYGLILLCAVLVTLVCGCGGAPVNTRGPDALSPEAEKGPTTGPAITDTEWKLTVVVTQGGERAFEKPELFTLRLSADGKARIRADCNRGSGPYTLAGHNLTIDIQVLTRAYCGPESFSDEYLRLLGQVESYRFEGNSLLLQLRSGSGSMSFSR